MITLNIIAGLLEDKTSLRDSAHGNRFCHKIVHLPDHLDERLLSLVLTEDVQDSIFIGMVDACAEVAACVIGLQFVCVSRLGEDQTLPAALLDEGVGLLRVWSDASMFEIVSRVQNRERQIASWAETMRMGIIQGAGYQGLVDVGELLLHGPLVVLNEDVQLVACSGIENGASPVLEDIVAQGALPRQAIEDLGLFSRRQKPSLVPGLHVEHIMQNSGDPLLACTFSSHGTFLGLALFACRDDDDSACAVDLFGLFSHQLDLLFRQGISGGEDFYQRTQALFDDLIRQRPMTQKTFCARLSRLRIKPQSNYRLFLFLYYDEERNVKLTKHILTTMQREFPEGIIAPHDEYYLLLVENAQVGPGMMERYQAFVRNYPCTIGASDAFESMREFVYAYQQALFVLTCVTEPYQTAEMSYTRFRNQPVLFFKDFFPRYVAELARNQSILLGNVMQQSILDRIHQDDLSQQTDDLRMLYEYLTHDRRVALTCKVLFMQRGTLLYRLKRLESRYDLDLDDFKTRQRLLMEYLLYAPGDAGDVPEALGGHSDSAGRGQKRME